VSRSRVARLTIFAPPVALPFAQERGHLAPAPGPAESAEGRRADLKLASHIRRNGHLTAFGHPCTHVHQSTISVQQANRHAIMRSAWLTPFH